MEQPLVVRPVRRSDYDQWLALWAGYNEFYGRVGESALDIAITSTTWSRFYDPYEPLAAFVAERDGLLLGFAHLLLHRSTTALDPIIYLQDLFASQHARRQGVGRLLIQAVYDHAYNLGVSRVYWQTHESNEAAMKLYDKVAKKSGFIVYQTLVNSSIEAA